MQRHHSSRHSEVQQKLSQRVPERHATFAERKATMIQFQNIRGILLDIEGTTSSISFVYDEMFPFVRRELDSFLDAHWADSDVQSACRQIGFGR